MATTAHKISLIVLILSAFIFPFVVRKPWKWSVKKKITNKNRFVKKIVVKLKANVKKLKAKMFEKNSNIK
tara:strand:+ start:2243 stop:2452 length:210 start_codon:yes stop_codon:yes gene_type:complete